MIQGGDFTKGIIYFLFLYQDGKGKGALKLKTQMAEVFSGFLNMKHA